MIEAIEVKNFRGIREGTLAGMSPISVLVGPNNSGKSTVLEALLMPVTNTRTFLQILLRRGGVPLDALERAIGKPFTVAIHQRNTSEPARNQRTATLARIDGKYPSAVISAKADGYAEPLALFERNVSGDASWSDLCAASTDGRITPTTVTNGPASLDQRSSFVDVETVRSRNALEDAYSLIEQAGKLPNVIAALRTSMASLDDLRILKIENEFVLHSFFKGSPPVPTYLAGDGFKRLLAVASALFSSEKLVLVEEPEAFQHPRYLRELVNLMLRTAAEGTQVVLSTHSIELIDLLLDSAPDGADYPTIHRTRLHEGRFAATTVSRTDALQLRSELMEDLRS